MVFPKNIATFARFRFLRSRSRHQNKPTKQTKTHNVMIKKQMYESPEVELLEIVVKQGLLQGSGKYSSSGTEYLTTDEEEDF